MVGFLRRHQTVILTALTAFAADQGSKLWVVRTLALGDSWPDAGFFRFTHVANTGSAFGLFGGQNLILTAASFIGIGVLLMFYRSHEHPTVWAPFSLGLMLAGAIGNLTDRIVLGHVTDFIDVGPWYIFNLADASIMTGVAILAATMLLTPQKPPAVPALATVSIPGDEEYHD